MSRERTGRSRRKRRALIRRLIPVAIALVLALLVLLVCAGAELWNKFSYSHTMADLQEYFELTQEDEAAILLNDRFINTKAYMSGGRFYVPLDFARKNICDNYYYDSFEEVLLHTGADSTVSSGIDTGDFIVRDGSAWLALDYLSRLVNLEVTEYDSTPMKAHIGIKDKWEEEKRASAVRDCDIRIRGGVKSDILTSVSKDEEVIILDRMEDWCSVITDDGFIGYVENKDLGEERSFTPQGVNLVEDTEIVHNLRDHRICLGWHQVIGNDGMASLSSVISKTKGMNVISPTWFSLSDTVGGVKNIGSRAYVEAAHAAGLEVWALIDNFQLTDTYEVLGPTSIRNILVGNIMREALTLGVDGINVDFETLSAECGPAFAQFIRELGTECRKEGLVLSVDNYVPREYTNLYDRKTQGEYADYVIIMGYDEHFSSSEESGSVASFNFVQEGIEKTLQEVDARQVINGVPFYTRIWKEGKTLESKAVGMQEAESFAAENGMEKVWNEECAQYYAEKKIGDVNCRIWFEDSQSLKAKLDLMSSHDLAGVACWKLGMEKSEVWDVIGAWMGQQ